MKQAFVVAGLFLGDERKGGMVDYLADKYGATLGVRYNGAAQAMHNVSLANGTHHTFSMFSSAALVGAITYIAKYVRVDPIVMFDEAKELRKVGIVNPLNKVLIDSRCLITTPWHKIASQIYAKQHQKAVTGMGVWETRDYEEHFPGESIYASDLLYSATLRKKATAIALYYCDRLGLNIYIIQNEINEFIRLIVDQFSSNKCPQIVNEDIWKGLLFVHDTIVFEGSQGILLDEHVGFQPYITSSNTRMDNAFELLNMTNDFKMSDIFPIGCTRIYATRHGAGHLPTEHKGWEHIHEVYNPEDRYQGEFRYGDLDLHLLNYALGFCPKNTTIALSHLDQYRPGMAIADRDRYGDRPVYVQTWTEKDFIDLIEQRLDHKVSIVSYGPNRENTKDYHV